MSSGTYGWQGDALEFPAGADASRETGVSPPGRARMRYNALTASLEVSLDGGVYVTLGTGGASSPWVEVGGTVRLQNIAWDVVIGAAAMVGTEKLRVVGDVRVDSTVFVSEVSTAPGSGMMLSLTNDVGLAQIQLGGGTEIQPGDSLEVIDGINSYVNIDTSAGTENMVFGGNAPIPAMVQLDSASLTLGVADNSATGFQLLQGANSYINLSTVNGAESIRFGGSASGTLGAEVNVGVGSLTLGVPDNSATAFQLLQGVNNYVVIDTTNGAESVSIGNSLSSVSVAVRDNSSLAFQILQGANLQLGVNTNNGTESLVLGNTTTNPDIIFDTGGEIQFPASALTLFELGADPAVVANAVKLYAVDDGGGVSALRARTDDGSTVEIRANAGGGSVILNGNTVIERSGTSVQVGAGTDSSIFLANSNGAVSLLTTGFTVITEGAGTGFTWSSLAFSIPERVGDPTATANVGKLYTKDVAGVTQLFYRRSDGTVVALT